MVHSKLVSNASNIARLFGEGKVVVKAESVVTCAVRSQLKIKKAGILVF